MDLLNNIQNANERKIVQENAVTFQQSEDVKQIRFQEYYSKAIMDWCNIYNPNNRQAIQKVLILKINEVINPEVLDEWESVLTAKDYVITRDGIIFRVELPSDPEILEEILEDDNVTPEEIPEEIPDPTIP